MSSSFDNLASSNPQDRDAVQQRAMPSIEGATSGVELAKQAVDRIDQLNSQLNHQVDIVRETDGENVGDNAGNNAQPSLRADIARTNADAAKPQRLSVGEAAVSGASLDEAAENARRSLLECVHQIITAPRRRDAIDALARRIGFECPGSSVRIAVGRRRIEQFYDSRLGWLPRGNSVRDDAADAFDTAIRDRDLSQRFAIAATDSVPNSQPTNSPPTNSQPEDSSPVGTGLAEPDDSQTEAARLPYVCIDLSPPVEKDSSARSGGRSKALILMMRPQAGEAVYRRPPDWLFGGAGTLATALASRPRMIMPGWMDFIGARPLGTLAITMLLVGGFGFWPVPYPVSCSAVVTPTQSRIVASPFEATLLTTSVMPGDWVKRGQTLLQLDGRPLQLEIDSIESEIRVAEKDANIALASGQIGEAQRANMTRSKLMHRADLLNSRLNQLLIVSPIDGVVMGGDLRRHVGSPLTVGQTLMEVAPVQRIALELAIPEFEVNLLRRDAMARIRFDAVGGRSESATLESIDSRSELREDQNVFIGRLTMENVDGQYRPGMKGDATVYGPVRPMAWSYIRPWWERLLWAVGY